MVEGVLQNLIEFTNSIDLNVRHGSVLAIAEILSALYNHYNTKIETIIGIHFFFLLLFWVICLVLQY